MLLLEKVWYKLATSLTGLLAAFFGLAAVMSIVEQANKWSITGVWTTITIADLLMAWGLTRPETPNYIGLQKIIDEVLTWPGIVANVILCFVFMSIWVWGKRGLNVSERKERRLTVIPRDEWEAAQLKKLAKKLRMS
jgi:cellulose synthase/poly-beta-1,6-N-acetylglucosamine synthase-like glycosyltransferase